MSNLASVRRGGRPTAAGASGGKTARRLLLVACAVVAACGASVQDAYAGASATVSSAAIQTFTVGQASTTASVLTVFQDDNLELTTGNDIRIKIPATFNMTWDTSVTTFTRGGTASAKVSATVTYDDNHTVVIDVTSAILNTETLTITGLKFTNFTAASAADNLDLISAGMGGASTDTDNTTITVVAQVVDNFLVEAAAGRDAVQRQDHRARFGQRHSGGLHGDGGPHLHGDAVGGRGDDRRFHGGCARLEERDDLEQRELHDHRDEDGGGGNRHEQRLHGQRRCAEYVRGAGGGPVVEYELRPSSENYRDDDHRGCQRLLGERQRQSRNVDRGRGVGERQRRPHRVLQQLQRE
jgi:hypothetical protein